MYEGVLCDMKIIGREKEIETLNQIMSSKKPEFVCVYGRRRVGKTYLIKQFFKDKFSFYITGVKDLTNRSQLSNFKKQLKKYGHNHSGTFKSWLEAFDGLIELLEQDSIIKIDGKRVVFIDETPWMDAPKSDFKAGLDYFWNTWGSSQEDLVLIVCGSATSWIINNLLNSTGGFYNRITKRLKLNQFNIREVKQLLEFNGVKFSSREIVETYMIFGGIPYYLNLLNEKLSLAQNVDQLFFEEDGDLKDERLLLLSSLFKKHTMHEIVLDTLYKRKSGLSKSEISKLSNLNSDKHLKTVLDELEQCGFIRSYIDYKTRKNNPLYQIIDPFILFAFDILEEKKSSWLNYIGTPKYYSWTGHAFEVFCLNHVQFIKEDLGILGVETNDYSFTKRGNEKGAQIDLVIDRKDEIVNLCEMKYSISDFEIDNDYETNLLNKVAVFKSSTKSKKSIKLTLVTLYGLLNNKHSHIIDQVISVEKWLG